MKKKKREKKVNKKIIKILTICLLIVILLLLGIYIVLKIEDKNRITKKSMGDTTTYTLKSTTLHKLKAEGVEATDIQIEEDNNILYFTINLKNNTNKKIHGFELGLEVLNSKNKQVTILYFSKEDTIQANGTYTLAGTANIEKNASDIDHAKLLYFHAKEEE